MGAASHQGKAPPATDTVDVQAIGALREVERAQVALPTTETVASL